MSATGSHLRIQAFGDNVLGVRLEGNPRKPEPGEFRVAFPGGDVAISRCTDGSYWVHVARNRADQTDGLCSYGQVGALTDARIDIDGRHTSELNVGDFANPDTYHVAVRIAVDSTRKEAAE